MWTRQGDLYNEVERWKKAQGEIPPETCPLIDSVIKVLDTPEATPEMLEALKIMEEVRTHNSKLRELGHDWYKHCEKLCEMGDKIIEELERQNEDLKYDIKHLTTNE